MNDKQREFFSVLSNGTIELINDVIKEHEERFRAPEPGEIGEEAASQWIDILVSMGAPNISDEAKAKLLEYITDLSGKYMEEVILCNINTTLYAICMEIRSDPVVIDLKAYRDEITQEGTPKARIKEIEQIINKDKALSFLIYNEALRQGLREIDEKIDEYMEEDTKLKELGVKNNPLLELLATSCFFENRKIDIIASYISHMKDLQKDYKVVIHEGNFSIIPRHQKQTEAYKGESALNQIYVNSYVGPFGNKLALLPSSSVNVNKITGKVTYTHTKDAFKITATQEGIEAVRNSIGKDGMLLRTLPRQKLFDTIILTFTHSNENKICFSLEEYLQNIGKNVIVSDEDDEAAKKRKKELLKKERQRLKDDLMALSHLQYEWRGTKKGKTSDFVIINMIEGVAVKKGYVYIKITETMAEALKGHSLMRFPICLLSLTNDNAYAIGYKMAAYYSNDQNMKMNRNNRLKVETLLKSSNIPLIEDLKDNARHWRERIKEPLEEALEELFKKGYLKDWKYCKSKGGILTDKEAMNISDYQTFINLYVEFEPIEAPDQTERLLHKEARAEARIEKSKKNKKDTKSSKKA